MIMLDSSRIEVSEKLPQKHDEHEDTWMWHLLLAMLARSNDTQNVDCCVDEQLSSHQSESKVAFALSGYSLCV